MAPPIKVNPDAVPIVAYGRRDTMAQGVSEQVAPEYDVVHTCTTLQSALTEFPALLSGDASVRPANNIGSNVHRPAGENVIPKVFCFGGGIPEDEAEQVKKAILDFPKEGSWKDEIKWVQVSREEVLKAMGGEGGIPKPEVSAGIAKRVMKEMGI